MTIFPMKKDPRRRHGKTAKYRKRSRRINVSARPTILSATRLALIDEFILHTVHAVRQADPAEGSRDW